MYILSLGIQTGFIMNTNRHDIIIVGGGIIGASIARHLSKFYQRDVAVIDAGHPGKATLAAVGMLTPACEWDSWTSVSQLAILNAGKHHLCALVDDLASELDWDHNRFGFRATDFTMLSLESETEHLRKRCRRLQAAGENAEWLNLDRLLDREKELDGNGVYGGIHIYDQGLVNPILLLDGLRLSSNLNGAIWYENTLVTSIEKFKTKWVIETQDQERFIGNELVIAAGAWSYEVGRLAGIHVPTTPVRGQIIELAGPAQLMNTLPFMPGGGCGSFAERSPGKYLLGTSEEYTDSGVFPTVQVISNLLERGSRIFRHFEEMNITDTWAGFRPGTRDEQPIVGTVGEKIHVATGHYRNGIMLSALTAVMVGELLNGGSTTAIPVAWTATRNFLPFYRFGSRY